AKMSKSKGNGINPLDVIERYGSDAMRFTLFDMATEGQDLKFPVQIVCPFCEESQELPSKRSQAVMKCRKCAKDFQQPVPNEPELPSPPAPPMGALDSKRFEKGRNFANKIWNAARFVLTTPVDSKITVELSNPARIQAGLLDEDKWILSRLNSTVRTTTEALEGFEFSK